MPSIAEHIRESDARTSAHLTSLWETPHNLVPLYKNGRVVGGLGISGDTPCADHEIAKRIRHLAGLDPAKGPTIDDIQFAKADRASVFTHPLCPNTWRNGQRIGDEAPAAGY